MTWKICSHVYFLAVGWPQIYFCWTAWIQGDISNWLPEFGRKTQNGFSNQLEYAISNSSVWLLYRSHSGISEIHWWFTWVTVGIYLWVTHQLYLYFNNNSDRFLREYHACCSDTYIHSGINDIANLQTM